MGSAMFSKEMKGNVITTVKAPKSPYLVRCRVGKQTKLAQGHKTQSGTLSVRT